ncbi:hypothetical protein DRP04_07785 [Archaeoglobales archaeon]|nr:MAG: hypothetical protein DRP04_07785 [Archaeoglobales archaeon]
MSLRPNRAQFERQRASTYLRWTKEEEQILWNAINSGKSIAEIQKEYFPHRTLTAVKRKINRLKKKQGIYNTAYASQKYSINKNWIEKAFKDIGEPLQIVDGYSGEGNSLLKCYIQYTNCGYAVEVNKKTFQKLLVNCQEYGFREEKVEQVGNMEWHLLRLKEKTLYCIRGNVEQVMAYLFALGKRVDFIDLDPCGSCMRALPLALRVVKRYITVTYGQLQAARFKRLDVLFRDCPFITEDKSFKEVFNCLVEWTLYEGIRAGVTLKMEEFKVLPNLRTGVVRVLFKVEKINAVADALNCYLSEIERVKKILKQYDDGI